YAFGIGQDTRYFNGILENLTLLGLHLEDLFIDNLLPGYQEMETGDNKNFVKNARMGIAELQKRFSRVKGSNNLPVFLTSYDVYMAVMKEGEKLYPASGIYKIQTEIPIPASKNMLGRPLIPLFRHKKYELNEHEAYSNHIIKYLFCSCPTDNINSLVK
ncbi:MAG: hypothetical protein ACNA7V_12240, partial [Bacteroidales bacterium]